MRLVAYVECVGSFSSKFVCQCRVLQRVLQSAIAEVSRLPAMQRVACGLAKQTTNNAIARIAEYELNE